MRLSTLCYIERDGQYLMLYRNAKEHDPNAGKWIGVGGGFEDGESPEECILREIREETGICPQELHFRGIVTFTSDTWETEYMHLFTAAASDLCFTPCSEGELRWIPKREIENLPLWEGDRIFLCLLAGDAPFFSLKLTYCGDLLTAAALNGKPLSLHDTKVP